jgi:hypothetical protein
MTGATTMPHPADRSSDAALLLLDPLHLEAIRLGAGAAAVLGMPTARDAAGSGHELWTAALLVHEIVDNPLWQPGWPRRASAVATALAAARRLTRAALASLAAEARAADHVEIDAGIMVNHSVSPGV